MGPSIASVISADRRFGGGARGREAGKVHLSYGTPAAPASDQVRSRARTVVAAVAIVIVAALVVGACSGDDEAGRVTPAAAQHAAAAGTSGLTPAQLAEAKRLVDPDHEPKDPTPAQVACVARVVVLNPSVDEIANDMAQIQNADLRELVMTDYLRCAYNFVLDLYMRFAPAGLTPEALACIRSEFTRLEVGRLAEVMVLDPDAGYTGPIVIHACETGAKEDPLAHGTLPGMGGGNS
jgi:hypothetical protein